MGRAPWRRRSKSQVLRAASSAMRTQRPSTLTILLVLIFAGLFVSSSRPPMDDSALSTPPRAFSSSAAPPERPRRNPPADRGVVWSSPERSSAANTYDSDSVAAKTEIVFPGRSDLSSLSFLTWNVWFGRLRQSERHAALLSDVLALDVDVACFQEVTSHFIGLVTSSEEIAAAYDVSTNRIYNYGVMTMAKKDLRVQFKEVEMPTGMGRTLLIAELHISGSAVLPEGDSGDSGGSSGDNDGGGSGRDNNATAAVVAVGNVHLESLDNEDLRREQLKIASNVLGEYTTGAVLCGDFNFDSSQTYGDWRRKGGQEGQQPQRRSKQQEKELENAVLGEVMTGWVDAWPYLKAGDPGITFDGATNPVCVRDKEERMRYDRIMVKMAPGASEGTAVAAVEKGGEEGGSAFSNNSPTTMLSPEDIEMVGTEPLDETGIKASDHYGLHIRIALGEGRGASAGK